MNGALRRFSGSRINKNDNDDSSKMTIDEKILQLTVKMIGYQEFDDLGCTMVSTTFSTFDCSTPDRSNLGTNF